MPRPAAAPKMALSPERPPRWPHPPRRWTPTPASRSMSTCSQSDGRRARARSTRCRSPRFAPAASPSCASSPSCRTCAWAHAVDRPQLALLLALNIGYAALSWAALRAWYGRTGALDLGLLFLHLDVLVWLANLRHLEQAHLFFACLLLVRVADQVGYGFRRAIYFNHVVLAAYLAYSCWVWRYRPAEALWANRLTIAATMYLLGIYLAFTGLVSERLRSRVRQAMQHGARAGRQPGAEEASRSRRRPAISRRPAGAPSRRTSPRRSSWRPSATRSARR